MKAWTRTRYGTPHEVLSLNEADRPHAGEGEVVIRVRAASVNPADWHSLLGSPYIIRPGSGLRTPRNGRVGNDAAGIVESVGPGVTGFRPGDEVFGGASGAFAEYAVGKQDNLVPKPANVAFEQAATVPIAALTALQGLRDKGRLQAGQSVLINGASGGVGTFAVQIAKALGAEVTAVCSTRNVEMVRSIGADHVVDYTGEDFTKGGRRFDILLDNVGNRPLRACRRVLAPEGRYVMVSGPKRRMLGPVPRMVRAAVLFRFGRQAFAFFVAKFDRADLTFLAELLETGKVKPVVEHTYGFDELPDALAYLGAGHAKGKIVVTI